MPPAPSGATTSYLPSSTRPTSGSDSTTSGSDSMMVGEESLVAAASELSRQPVETDSPAASALACVSLRDSTPPCDVCAPQRVQNCAPSRKGWWHSGQSIIKRMKAEG